MTKRPFAALLAKYPGVRADEVIGRLANQAADVAEVFPDCDADLFATAVSMLGKMPRPTPRPEPVVPRPPAAAPPNGLAPLACRVLDKMTRKRCWGAARKMDKTTIVVHMAEGKEEIFDDLFARRMIVPCKSGGYILDSARTGEIAAAAAWWTGEERRRKMRGSEAMPRRG